MARENPNMGNIFKMKRIYPHTPIEIPALS
jgi:hypothetical protein